MDTKKNIRREILFILIIVISSFAIRWYQIESVPRGIEPDELAWIATALFLKHDIRASDKGLWDLNDKVAESFPTSVKINQLGFLVFGKDIYSGRKILVFFSVLSLITFYLLCRRFFDSIISFCLTLMYSFSTYKLIIARIAAEPAYADLFLYLFMVAILTLSSQKRWLNYLLTLLAVFSLIAGLFTYALSSFFPVLGALLLFFQLAKTKLKIKDKFIILLIFLVPLIVVSPKWLSNMRVEAERKSESFGGMVFDLKTKKINTSILKENVVAIKGNLLNAPTYDMIVEFGSGIIPLAMVYLSLIGIFLSLLKIRRFYPIQIWFGLAFAPMVLFGLYSGRMWVNLVGAFFLFSGIPIAYILNSRLLKNKKFPLIVLILFTFWLMYSGAAEFYKKAVNNPAFFPHIGEVVKLTREYKKGLTHNVAFVSDRNTNEGAIFPVTTFYYLAQNPKEENRIKKLAAEDMLIYKNEIFIELSRKKLDRLKFIIVDNNLEKEIGSWIENSIGQILKRRRLSYFTVLEK